MRTKADLLDAFRGSSGTDPGAVCRDLAFEVLVDIRDALQPDPVVAPDHGDPPTPRDLGLAALRALHILDAIMLTGPDANSREDLRRALHRYATEQGGH